MKAFSPPHLLMFDVDGTLVQSLDLEAKLFPRACELALGIEHVSSDWSSYRTPSDAGIVAELVERHFDRSSNTQDIAAVEARFFDLLTREVERDRSSFIAVRGVTNMLRRIRSLPDTVLAIATAGWSTSARLKLATAGVELGDVAFASAHDAPSKIEIMSVALTRALEAAQVPSFASLTYVGDSAVDAQAAQALGFHFIGIDTSGWVSHVPHRFLDFSDHDAFVDRVLTLRETPR